MSIAIVAGLAVANDTGTRKKQLVLVGSGVNIKAGMAVVTVSGYGVLPTSSNYSTGKFAGFATTDADNTNGSNGDISVVCEDGERDLKNDGTHACSQATVGANVYLSDYETLSTTSTDGPLAGTLRAYNTAGAISGHPCRLRCNVG